MRPRGFTFSSQHPGGCHVTYVDGHTRFLGESTDAAVLSAVLTRAGGEALSQ